MSDSPSCVCKVSLKRIATSGRLSEEYITRKYKNNKRREQGNSWSCEIIRYYYVLVYTSVHLHDVLVAMRQSNARLYLLLQNRDSHFEGRLRRL